MNKILFFLSLVACLFLSSCGFHLRGETVKQTPDLKTVYIQDNVDARTGLVFALRQNLQMVGMIPAKNTKNAPYSLVILKDQFNQSLSTLGSAQQLNALVLTYNVTVVLRDNHGKDITPPVPLSAQSQFWQNSNQILGDQTAIPRLEQLLVRNMAEKIMAYLNSDNVREGLHARHA